MSDLTTTGLIVTITVALSRAVEWLAKALLKRNGGGNGASGQKPVSFWEGRMGRIVEEGIDKALRGRNEQIRVVFLAANEPVYEKLEAMVRSQEQMLQKFNDVLIELARQRNP